VGGGVVAHGKGEPGKRWTRFRVQGQTLKGRVLMLKIVDGIPFIGKFTDRFRVKAVDLGHGHIEVITPRVVEWEEADWAPGVMEDHLEVVRKFREEHADEVELRNRERAARRARTRVRRLCKAMGADALLTLTYRACEADLARAKIDLKEFNRRMCRELPGFRFVACFERQKRGSWHMHLATAGLPVLFEKTNDTGQKYRVKSFDVFRAVWRSVTQDRGGNVDIARRKKNSQRGAAKIAAYIAKYIGKAFAEGMGKGSNRWAKYGNVEVPELVELGVAESLMQALGMAYDILDDAHVVATMALDRFQDWFFLAAERPKGFA
jgi:hypothetical protein